jgi:hypothetical protein
MATLYTLSTLNEYTWTALYQNKEIFLSYIAASKSQAVSGLTNLLNQLEYIKRKIADGEVLEPQKHIFMNLYIQENMFQYSYSTLVTTVENKIVTLGNLILNSEPTVEKFRLGTIKDRPKETDISLN